MTSYSFTAIFSFSHLYSASLFHWAEPFWNTTFVFTNWKAQRIYSGRFSNYFLRSQQEISVIFLYMEKLFRWQFPWEQRQKGNNTKTESLVSTGCPGWWRHNRLIRGWGQLINWETNKYDKSNQGDGIKPPQSIVHLSEVWDYIW